MTDIIATETAKARKQAVWFDMTAYRRRERMVTALLEAKADVLEEVRGVNEPSYAEMYLRQEVLNRRQRGL